MIPQTFNAPVSTTSVTNVNTLSILRMTPSKHFTVPVVTMYATSVQYTKTVPKTLRTAGLKVVRFAKSPSCHISTIVNDGMVAE